MSSYLSVVRKVVYMPTVQPVSSHASDLNWGGALFPQHLSLRVSHSPLLPAFPFNSLPFTALLSAVDLLDDEAASVLWVWYRGGMESEAVVELLARVYVHAHLLDRGARVVSGSLGLATAPTLSYRGSYGRVSIPAFSGSLKPSPSAFVGSGVSMSIVRGVKRPRKPKPPKAVKGSASQSSGASSTSVASGGSTLSGGSARPGNSTELNTRYVSFFHQVALSGEGVQSPAVSDDSASSGVSTPSDVPIPSVDSTSSGASVVSFFHQVALSGVSSGGVEVQSSSEVSDSPVVSDAPFVSFFHQVALGGTPVGATPISGLSNPVPIPPVVDGEDTLPVSFFHQVALGA